MGVPKRRKSHARQGNHRAHDTLTLPKLESCSHCHEPKQIHHACPNCGYYGGREAVRIKPPSAREPAGS